MIILIGALILASGLMAQKPVVDLVSSQHQHKRSEAVIDTGYTENPLVREPLIMHSAPYQNEKIIEESEKKKRRQIGPSIDSLFHNKEAERKSQEKVPVKTSLFNSKYNPIKILIYIIVLK